MNLHALRVFYYAAQLGSMTRAAEELHISQPAVTAQIRNLEQELRLTLFVPKGRGVLLTEAGNKLASHASRLFALEAEVEREMADFLTGRTGTLRIAATALPANFLLPDWLAAYREEAPEVSAALMTLNARDALKRLRLYEADIALIGGMGEEHPGLERRLVLEDEMWFIVPPHHPLAGTQASPARMMEEAFIMREAGSASRDRLQALCRTVGVRLPEAALTTNGVHETIGAVSAGIGAAFVSSIEAYSAIERGEAARVTVTGMAMANPVMLYIRRNDPLSPEAALFIKLLKLKTSNE
jgi:DNA-binding transcriptional LysR family regulator